MKGSIRKNKHLLQLLRDVYSSDRLLDGDTLMKKYNVSFRKLEHMFYILYNNELLYRSHNRPKVSIKGRILLVKCKII